MKNASYAWDSNPQTPNQYQSTLGVHSSTPSADEEELADQDKI